jgi:acetyl-CoA carboxylase biotin carboxyl carrier protein
VDLTGDDVRDILQLLDGLPYRELTLETASFRLSLRRDADGAWTQAMQVVAEPNVLPTATDGAVSDGAVTDGAVTDGAVTDGAVTDGAVTDGAVTERAVTAAGTTAAGAAAPGTPAAAGESVPVDGLVEVRAPLLGTFYRAPRPGAPPFVTVGSEVAPDTVVCIIETMKLMNSVTAGVGGTVAEILLDNAQFAAQGVVLMRVREQR